MKVERLGKRETPLGLLGYKELKASLDSAATVEEIIIHAPWTMIKLNWADNKKIGMWAPGFSRCMYTDAYHPGRGMAIARGRAVTCIARLLWDTASGTKGE